VEITMTNPTQLVLTSDIAVSGIAMPMSGQSCFGVLGGLAVERPSWIQGTGLSIEGFAFDGGDVTGTTRVVRDRKDLAAKGHVAFAAYVPGYPAWSPPIC
jgi:hypothetical protein